MMDRFLRNTLPLAGLLLLGTTAQAARVSGQGTWETTLQGRDLDGDNTTAEAWYDSVLGITWLRDANHARTTGFDADGRMTWARANIWAAGLDPYGSGITGWRLPTVTDTGTPGCDWSYDGTDCGHNVDTATGEMASMYYDTLGNLAYFSTDGSNNQPGWGLSNTGPFENLQSNIIYWSATEYAPYTRNAWAFGFSYGVQLDHYKTDGLYGWAVHAGDVGAVVPIPGAAWLFGSALLGLVGVGAKRRR